MIVQITRRVHRLNADRRPVPGIFDTAVEQAELVQRMKHSALVKLANGDIIKRKLKDIKELAS